MDIDPNVRSEDSLTPSYIILYNTTIRKIDVYWIDYQSAYIRYKTLPPSRGMVINTFLTHPWVFKDADSGELMCVNNKRLFLPPESPDRSSPKRLFIHLPLRTLKEITMWSICSNILFTTDGNLLDHLELPKILLNELKNINEKCIKNKITLIRN